MIYAENMEHKVNLLAAGLEYAALSWRQLAIVVISMELTMSINILEAILDSSSEDRYALLKVLKAQFEELEHVE